MENKHTNIPTKVEEKFSFINLIRKLLNKTSKAKDIKGRIKYISYPPKKGFSSKQKREIEELEINDVSIVGENRDVSLNELSNLKKLYLGRDVIAVTEGSIPNSGIEVLELSDTVKQIPPNAITQSSIKKVQGKNFCIASSSRNTISDIYIDTDERLHYVETGHISLGMSDYIEQHGGNVEEEVAAALKTISEGILNESSASPNEDTLYIYDEGKSGSRVFTIHTLLDKFPIPDGRNKTFPDDKLIGILINGKEEIDLEQLAVYPNLQNIYIGQNVKRVLSTGDLRDTKNINQKNIVQKEQKSVSGKIQKVNLTSKDTVVLTNSKKDAGENPISKTVEKEDELSI